MIAAHYPHLAAVALMMIGLYTVLAHANLIKKLLGLGVFQVGVFMLYISLGKLPGGTAPILAEGFVHYSHPLPHVLILTAIVVGVASTALGLALAVRVHEAYGTVEEDRALAADREREAADR